MTIIKHFKEIKKNEIKLVGGKGLSLALLVKAGLPVPPGFVVTTEVYKNKKITAETEKSILKAFGKLGAQHVAVRSSAIFEDSPNASWAGQFESLLNVKRDELINAINEVWQSASSKVVKEYASNKNKKNNNLAIAVVVQEMVESEVSGVAFSVNPVNNNFGEIMIEAIYGLGELLVQGMVTPDNYIVDKESFEIINKNVPVKTTMLAFDGQVNVTQKVQKDKAEKSCLGELEIKELAKIVLKTEKYFHTPQDVEWAYKKEKFYIVQARPITTLVK